LTQSVLFEDLRPDVLGAGLNDAGKLCQVLFLLRNFVLATGVISHAHRAGLLQHIADVTAHEQRNQTGDNQTSDASDTHFGAGTHTAAILNIGAFASSF